MTIKTAKSLVLRTQYKMQTTPAKRGKGSYKRRQRNQKEIEQ